MTYFPPPHPAAWATVAAAGLGAEAIAAAPQHAGKCETPWERNLAVMVTSDFQEIPPWNETPRAGAAARRAERSHAARRPDRRRMG